MTLMLIDSRYVLYCVAIFLAVIFVFTWVTNFIADEIVYSVIETILMLFGVE